MFNPLNKNVQSISKIQKYYSAQEKTLLNNHLLAFYYRWLGCASA